VFTVALLVTATILYFLVSGLATGSVSSFNGALWAVLTAVAVGVPVIAWRLRARGKLVAAIAILSMLALPGLMYLLFLVLVVASGTSWR
jgi:hypothetical protein